MKELIRSNDPVVLSFAEAVLREAGIAPHIFDLNASILEGSIGILPRRVMVLTQDHVRASQILKNAGLSDELEKEK